MSTIQNPALPIVQAWLDLVELRDMDKRELKCASAAEHACTEEVTHRVLGKFCGVNTNVCQGRVDLFHREANRFTCGHCDRQGNEHLLADCWTIIPI